VRRPVVLLLIAGCLLWAWVANPVNRPPAKQPTEHYLKAYQFSTDWFTNRSRISVWEEVLGPMKGTAFLNYLEVGVYEGRSAIWMLENILTHPTARLIGVDTFPGDLKERFMTNVRISGFERKVTAIKGYSRVELRNLPLGRFDIIYIDGSHAAADVLADAVLSWELLKNGGLLIFDDYPLWPHLPDERRPQIAIDAFISVYRNSIEVIHQDWMVILRKRSGHGMPLR